MNQLPNSQHVSTPTVPVRSASSNPQQRNRVPQQHHQPQQPTRNQHPAQNQTQSTSDAHPYYLQQQPYSQQYPSQHSSYQQPYAQPQYQASPYVQEDHGYNGGYPQDQGSYQQQYSQYYNQQQPNVQVHMTGQPQYSAAPVQAPYTAQYPRPPVQPQYTGQSPYTGVPVQVQYTGHASGLPVQPQYTGQALSTGMQDVQQYQHYDQHYQPPAQYQSYVDNPPSPNSLMPPPAGPKKIRIDTSIPLPDLREQVKQSTDPLVHLDFVRYLVSVADEMARMDNNRQNKMSREIEQVLNEALKWCKRLAAGGTAAINKQGKTPPCADAQVYLAECFGNGLLGLSVDHEKAYSYYHQASKLDHAEANYRVALCSEMGVGTKRDPHRAVTYYKKAAVLGDPASMYKLGVIQLYGGLGFAASPREGIVMLKRAAAAATPEYPQPLHELAMLHEPTNDGIQGMKDLDSRIMHEIMNLVQPNPTYAVELYTQCATLGYAPSQYRLGVCYQDAELSCAVNPKASISWFTKAAEQGHPEAELALSGWYLEGVPGLLPVDESQAFAWARKAADKGLFKAEYAIGYYFEMGIGVNSNIEEARRFYQRAAAQGSRRAMERLSDLNNVGKRPHRPDQVKREKGDCIIM